eukprot:CAMPEP_0174993556 /NCGR_PEP_ID=MMETSP0004_2-20121128/23139_1 /TAXON_ID=420556 /ORGANISM="Ochromonas sp., Strain CCMP1393" /LENGTH=231 /DNA_ID=CAMNT_0016247681 /DNA_START=71 /DNA_END=766 /DNA_ORIENTATION=+
MAASVLTSAEGTALTHPIASRGAFILFEGVDRCGKTTQTGLLKEYYEKSRKTEQIRFPERSSAVGQLINSYLQSSSNLNDQSIHLLFSANRWEQSDSINEKLLAGCNLICDRYAYSGVAFTSAKGLDLDWCKSCDVGLPAPDCIIYLDMPIEDAAKRGNFGEERYEKIDFQKSVRDQFLKLKEEDTSSGIVPWKVLNADQSIEDLHREIIGVVNAVMVDVANKPVKKLWVK